MSITILMQHTAEALEAAIDMQRALAAAAKLLMDCTCHNARSAESRAVCELADNAVARFQAAGRQIRQITQEHAAAKSARSN